MADVYAQKGAQRAYTLRLTEADPSDSSWREKLWLTHEAINKGAKAFGDWLLTLRGGLCHTLAEAPVSQAKGKPDRLPTSEEIKGRRILLALSWLSVEDDHGAPPQFLVVKGSDSTDSRSRKLNEALISILQSRQVSEEDIGDAKRKPEDQPGTWLGDCLPSLSAVIRKDAVWVNRSKAFDEAAKTIGPSLTPEEAWDMLERFFGSREAYLAPAKVAENGTSAGEGEDKAKDLVQKAGQWLSSRFGTGKGANFGLMAEVYKKIAGCGRNVGSDGITGESFVIELADALKSFNPASADLQGILGLISGPGYKSATRNYLQLLAAKASVTNEERQTLCDKAQEDAEKCDKNTGSKGQREYSQAILKNVESVCGFRYLQDSGPARHREFAVMLDHAARRVSLAHTWVKRSEAERRNFEDDAKRIESVPDSIKDWLDEFCSVRTGASGALEQYRIRRRAIDGWKEVVSAWGGNSCKTEEDRIAVARELQDDPEIMKFGDIQLFEALADEDALCVWHKEGDLTKDPDPQPLLDYVLAADAGAKKRRFKVPAYRHPDALLHPVFCDFGKSRWEITFAVHKDLRPANTHALSLKLWNGSSIEPEPSLRWHSKRLVSDLALDKDVRGANTPKVTRADRLGLAAADVLENGSVGIAGLFEQEDWNGRLQAPRPQLEALATLRDNKHLSLDERLHRMFKMMSRIRWLLTFSAKLQPQGPWCELAGGLGLKADPQYWPHAEQNKVREGQARLILCGIPGLRVLSVDLGHRYAAACAVWEALTKQAFDDECRDARAKGANVVFGPDECKPEEALYAYFRWPEKQSNAATKKAKTESRAKKFNPVTVYRRIAGDALSSGNPHPAPWARLDRQFLIKLQGEEQAPRAASDNEMKLVDDLAKRLGLGVDEDRTHSRSVDELMTRAVRLTLLALKRHARRAKITYALDPVTRSALGMGGTEIAFQPGDTTHVKVLTDALFDWHSLASESKWNDTAARDLWNQHIAVVKGGWRIEEPDSQAQDTSERTRQQRRKDDERLRESLIPIALQLAKANRSCMHKAWDDRWAADDGPERVKSHFQHVPIKDANDKIVGSFTVAKMQTSGLHAELRWVTDWIMGRRLFGERRRRWTRNVGGLSVTRIATMRSLYQLHKSFAMRPRPNKPRGAPEKGESNTGVAQSILDAMKRMRDNRVKQLASRIVEGALGIGRMKRLKRGRDARRPRTRVDEPCHAIVIENLTRYRPEEIRTRRENRQLMNWSAAKVKKFLAEACQLNGLHLREVSAGYTSRQDCRTGSPGIRCQDVPVKEFMQSPFWRNQVARAEEKQAQNKGDARERFLCDLNEKCKSTPEAGPEKAKPLRIPLRGGELFVSADSKSPAAKGLQADLNAAANIGLRALTDPDWPGRWWYVPCDPISFKPLAEKVKGSTAIDLDKPLMEPAVQSTDRIKKKGGRSLSQSREVRNLWHNVSSQTISSEEGTWEVYDAYSRRVQEQVIREVLRDSAGSVMRLKKE